MRAVSVRAAFLLLAGLLVVPSANAQAIQPVLTLTAGPDPYIDRLMPETGEAQGDLMAVLEVPPGSVCLEPLQFLFSVKEAPRYATVQILEPKQSVTIMPSPNNVAYEVRTAYTVRTTRDAPAFDDGLYKFGVTVLTQSWSQGCTVGGADAAAMVLIQNDYRPEVRIGAASVQHEGMSGQILVPIENFGNGPTRVRADLGQGGDPRFLLLNANDIVLESKANGEDAASSDVVRIDYVLDGVEVAPIEVRFLVGHDLFNSEYEVIVAQFTAIGTLSSASSDAAEAAGVDDPEGVPALPGPGVPMVLLASAALVALVRRRTT
jgi:hypothetical protein